MGGILKLMKAAHRILVVDDGSDIVDVVSMALRYQGFDVASAGSGQEALSQVSAVRPHRVVLDVMLPDMEGFEVPSGRACSARASRSSS